VEIEAFRAALVKICEAAMYDFRHYPSEETYHRTCGRLEGFLQGVIASARELEDAAAVERLVLLAREVTDGYLQELRAAGVA